MGIKKTVLKWAAIAGILATTASCTADIDTFGTSDYRVLNEISFEEQDGRPSISANEQRIAVKLSSNKDCSWDSVTIDDLSISSLATFHTVLDSIGSFPKDSTVLDSLARKVSYESKKIKIGSKIEIPENDTLYIVVVSESGIPALWQIAFSKPSESCDTKSDKDSDKEKSSSSAKSESSNKSSSSTGSDSPKSSSSASSSESNKTPDSPASTASSSESSEETHIPADAPKILSLKIASMEATIDSGKIHIHLDTLPFLADLSNLELTELELSEGATCESHKTGETYDFGVGQEIVIKNSDGESITYIVKAGYQIPGSDFNDWNGDDVIPDSLWGNANTLITTTKKYTSGSMTGARIATTALLGKTASGSLYSADFNPNNVGTLSMANSSTWPDGNELIDFGKHFNARPEYAEVKFSYDGSGDSCDIYILLESRDGDKNINRGSDDINKLVASTWYRSTTNDNTGRENPDVVSISDKDENGMRTLRLKFRYGTPLENSPIENSSTFATSLQSSNKSAIDNSLIQGEGNESVTHIRVVFASSADGNHYKGVKNATLIIDDLKLIY
ncbi:PCMD domain-containing protein [Fibrobacter sp. UWH4]|uniref:PCMD domain-containing protein n=1 Tax=Fibrobacter sp. UWH4 TaxID=1896210 RepID=UPI00091B7EB8|nr:PCMD domain-containing protein [Fibrobacter sp. UWH4]SHK21335.1 Putative carbohydrate metabolism domain-containing protein [Fibrobacter sp. UWH4]